jgi:ATP-dependent DNA helicase RecG
MIRSELIEFISNGENSGVEFKLDGIRPEQLAKEVVAMANFQGGKILIGVADDGSIHGVQRKNLESWVMDTVFGRYVHPMILPFYQEIQMESDRRIAVISFPPGISKPYVVRHNDREDIYVRVGSTSRLATREQQARLFAVGGMFHTELMPVAGSSVASLDKARLENYLRDIIQDPEVPQTDGAWIQRLLGLGFLVEDPGGQPVCTIAGLVLFGISPRRYLRQTGLRLLAFAGEDKEYRSLLDEVIDAPLVGRWNQEGKGEKILVDEGLIEKFSALIGPFVSQEADHIDRNMRRTRNWLYPFEAIRETVINALAHRDWTRFVDIEVGIYSDRIEIVSPGALPNTMTVAKMKAGQRSPRNPLVVEILRDYGYVDARGMGIRTKVIPLMKHHNQTEPIFEATEDFLKTLLRKAQRHLNGDDAPSNASLKEKPPVSGAPKAHKSGRNASNKAPLTSFQVQLVTRIEENPSISYDVLAEKLDKNRTTVMRNIQKLKNIGALKRIGSKKTGYWEVIG